MSRRREPTAVPSPPGGSEGERSWILAQGARGTPRRLRRGPQAGQVIPQPREAGPCASTHRTQVWCPDRPRPPPAPPPPRVRFRAPSRRAPVATAAASYLGSFALCALALGGGAPGCTGLCGRSLPANPRGSLPPAQRGTRAWACPPAGHTQALIPRAATGCPGRTRPPHAHVFAQTNPCVWDALQPCLRALCRQLLPLGAFPACGDGSGALRELALSLSHPVTAAPDCMALPFCPLPALP